MRFEHTDTCTSCGLCNGSMCDPVRKKLRSYSGSTITADLFDCALPVAIDSHSVCAYSCVYCFSENLFGHTQQHGKEVGQTSLKTVETLFSGSAKSGKLRLFRDILDVGRDKHGYPCPVQVGAINDPGDSIERQQGWVLELIKLAIKYNQPIRFSTKGTVFRDKDYLKEFAKKPELFWVAFSIISPDDDVLRRVDVGAPNATERLKTMKALSKIGVKTSLRFRPIFPGISDRTPKYKQAYKVLLDKASDAGARACSFECGFYPSRISAEQKKKWDKLASVCGIRLRSVYKSFGVQSCTRPPYTWTEHIMHAISERAKENGLVRGVSDPVWKQLTDTGCCCGILPSDPIHGNWNRRNATNALYNAKRKKDHLVRFWDATPEWVKKMNLTDICFLGAGPVGKSISRRKSLLS